MDYQKEYWTMHPNMHLSDAERKVRELRDTLPEGLNVTALLDVGCGAGEITTRLTALLATRGFGVDVSSVVLTAAREGRHELGVSWIQANAFTLPFGEDQVGLVVIADLLEHLSEPVRAVCEAQRVGEALLLRAPIENNFVTRLSMMWGKDEWGRLERKYGHIHHFSVSDLFQLVEEGGFKIENWRAFEVPSRKNVLRNIISRILHKVHGLMGLRICGGFLVLYCRKRD